MTETTILLLREKPLFEIQIQERGFLICNDADQNDNGLYEFDKIDHLRIEKKRINWFVSISSVVVDFFLGAGTGDIYREKYRLRLNYADTEKHIMLDNCDMKATERAIQKIKSHVH